MSLTRQLWKEVIRPPFQLQEGHGSRCGNGSGTRNPRKFSSDNLEEFKRSSSQTSRLYKELLRSSYGKTVYIAGLGLIGASMALGIKRDHPDYEILGYNRSQASRDIA